ncbi:MAG: TIGR04086 family membrane protein [Clostridia bacterium]|nr:TIGR04086 family membrane protein [Clostridia bacterium]
MESRKQSGANARRASAAKDDLGIMELIRSVLFGLAVMAISALVLLLIGTGIAYSNEDPAAFEMPLSLAALYISIFFGGFAAAKKSGQNKLLGGIIFTALAFLLIFLLKLIMSGRGEDLNGSTYYLLGALGASAAGTVMSVFSPRKKPMSKKKRAEKFGKKK